jgi:hypothetical protein
MNFAGLGMIGIVLLVKLIFAVIWVGVPVLLVGALVWWTTSRRGVPENSRARQTKSSRIWGLRIGALVGVVTVLISQPWLGPIAVAAGYLLGVLRGELRDAPPKTGTVRVASLQPRTAAGYVPWWAALIAVVAAVVTVFGPIVLLAVPAPSYGPWHPFPDARWITLPGQQLSWPSPAIWVPLAAVAAGALVIGALLIRRAVELPATIDEAPGLIESTRRNAARTITGTVVGVELLALGAQALSTSGGVDVPDVIGGTAYTISRVLVWSGLGLVLAGIVVWCVLSWWRRGPADPKIEASSPQT